MFRSTCTTRYFELDVDGGSEEEPIGEHIGCIATAEVGCDIGDPDVTARNVAWGKSRTDEDTGGGCGATIALATTAAGVARGGGGGSGEGSRLLS